MNRKEAMEGAREYIESDFVSNIEDCRNQLATLFQEATKSRYLIGEKVEVKNMVTCQWQTATIFAGYPNVLAQWAIPENVRPLREKRPMTREELVKALNLTLSSRYRDETLQMIARDLGISTEVECE